MESQVGDLWLLPYPAQRVQRSANDERAGVAHDAEERRRRPQKTSVLRPPALEQLGQILVERKACCGTDRKSRGHPQILLDEQRLIGDVRRVRGLRTDGKHRRCRGRQGDAENERTSETHESPPVEGTENCEIQVQSRCQRARWVGFPRAQFYVTVSGRVARTPIVSPSSPRHVIVATRSARFGPLGSPGPLSDRRRGAAAVAPSDRRACQARRQA